MWRALIKGSVLAGFGHLPWGAGLYHFLTRRVLGTQATHVDKLKRVVPGYLEAWREEARVSMAGLRLWIHEPGWTPFWAMAGYLITGRGPALTNAEGRMLDRYLRPAFDAILKMSKGSKIGDVCDFAHHTLVDEVVGLYQAPGIGLQAAQAETDSAVGTVELQDINVHFISDLDDATKVTGNICENFSSVELLGLRELMVTFNYRKIREFEEEWWSRHKTVRLPMFRAAGWKGRAEEVKAGKRDHAFDHVYIEYTREEYENLVKSGKVVGMDRARKTI